MPLDKLRPLADGRVFTGRKAISIGFADHDGGEIEAIDIAADMAKIPGEPRVLRRGAFRRFLGINLDQVFRGKTESSIDTVAGLAGLTHARTPALLYLYIP